MLLDGLSARSTLTSRQSTGAEAAFPGTSGLTREDPAQEGDDMPASDGGVGAPVIRDGPAIRF